MEGRLAELADMVVVVVESAGTFAELGAFSLNPRLLTKLLPIVDSQYANDDSFINTGPLRSVNQESAFRPAIRVKFKGSFLLCAGQVEQRLRVIPNLRYSLTSNDIEQSPKQLLLFLVSLVGLLFPVSEVHLVHYLSNVFSLNRPVRVSELLSLAVSLGLLQAIDVPTAGSAKRFFFPAQRRQLLRTERFDYWAARARVASVLQRIPEGLAALERIETETARVAP
jgi:hypothetical protein